MSQIQTLDRPANSAHRRRPFLGTITLQQPAFCFGCGSPLPPHGWHVMDGCAFCNRCPDVSHERCIEVLKYVTRPAFYQIVTTQNGILWLAPLHDRFQGHSIWRIYMSCKAAADGDNAAAAWYLTHPKTTGSPEDAHHTNVPNGRHNVA